jgi:hypothetical protein
VSEESELRSGNLTRSRQGAKRESREREKERKERKEGKERKEKMANPPTGVVSALSGRIAIYIQVIGTQWANTNKTIG